MIFRCGAVFLAGVLFAMTGAAAAQPEHFHPKGKPPSKHTLVVLRKAKATLPFADRRDFEEYQKGFIAPMKDLKIMADAGHVAWDMERYQFLNEQDEFDSIHPSLTRQSKLNMNYGLYEVIPGIYQVRGLDLSDLPYFEAFSWWKMACIVEGVYGRLRAGVRGGLKVSEGTEQVAARVERMLERRGSSAKSDEVTE